MRLLHTSDWHLGRSLHRADLRAAQEGFVDHLVDTVQAERVDVVLVSGDVYDRAIPSVDAVQLCESALARLRDTGARVVVISGNHDSARRLGFGSALIDGSGVFLRTDVARAGEPLVLDGVSFFAIPYLEPEAVRQTLPASGHAGVLGLALERARAALRTEHSVVLAHAWVGSGFSSDSERDLGGAGGVPAALFDGFTYAALGHLHGPQVLADHLRYSGSPLAYSFSEARHRKGSWLVEVGADGLGEVAFVEAPVPRRLSSLRGELAALLADPHLAGQEGDWLSVVLTDAARPEDAMRRLQNRFPHVLVLGHEPAGVVDDGLTYAARVARRTDQEVAEAFVQHVRRTAPSRAESSLLADAFAAGRVVA